MSRTRTALVVVAALAAAGFAAPAAQAETKKHYAVTITTPQSSDVQHSQVFEVTVTNKTERQAIGSLNLTAPDAATFDIDEVVSKQNVGADASVVANDDVLEVRNADIRAGAPAVIVMRVNTGAVQDVTSPATWLPDAKQANNHNGQPGNAFTLMTSESALSPELTRPAETGAATCDPDCEVTVSYRDSDETVTLKATGTPAETQPPSKSSASLLPTSLTTLHAELPAPSGFELTHERCGVSAETFLFAASVTGLVTGPPTHTKRITFTVDKIESLGPPPGICYAGPLPSDPHPTYLPGEFFVAGGSVFFPSILNDCTDVNRRFSACVEDATDRDGDREYVVSVPAFFADPVYRG